MQRKTIVRYFTSYASIAEMIKISSPFQIVFKTKKAGRFPKKLPAESMMFTSREFKSLLSAKSAKKSMYMTTKNQPLDMQKALIKSGLFEQDLNCSSNMSIPNKKDLRDLRQLFEP